MSSIFYKELLGIDLYLAERISKFIDLVSDLKAVVSPTPWAGHGKARVYFTLWSQNKLSPVKGFDKAHYDAEDNEVTIQCYYFGVVKINLSGKFHDISGAKTRAELEEFRRVFYEQKVHWD